MILPILYCIVFPPRRHPPSEIDFEFLTIPNRRAHRFVEKLILLYERAVACRFVFYTARMGSFSPNSMELLGFWAFLFFIFFTAFGRSLAYIIIIIIIYLLRCYYSRTHEFIFRSFLTNTSLSYRKCHRGPPTLAASCLVVHVSIVSCACVYI